MILIYHAFVSDDYFVKIIFRNGELRQASMQEFIYNSKNPLITQYKDKEKFKRDFSFDKNGLYWGNDLSVSTDWVFKNSVPIR